MAAEFNTDRPNDDVVLFYGFDAQFVEGPATAVREYLADVDPEFIADVDDNLRLLESEAVRGERYNVAAEHVDVAEATVAVIADRFERRADDTPSGPRGGPTTWPGDTSGRRNRPPRSREPATMTPSPTVPSAFAMSACPRTSRGFSTTRTTNESYSGHTTVT